MTRAYDVENKAHCELPARSNHGKAARGQVQKKKRKLSLGFLTTASQQLESTKSHQVSRLALRAIVGSLV